MKLNKTKSTGSTQSSVDEDEALLVEKIQAIHDHFQETTSSNNQEDTNCSFEDPIFEEINKAFKLGDTNEESNGSPIDQQLDSLMTSIMDELLSKEVLYEPLKELSTKYPKWLQEHSNDCNIETYKKQFKLHERIVQLFEKDDVEERSKIEELFSKLQELGNPPDELLAVTE